MIEHRCHLFGATPADRRAVLPAFAARGARQLALSKYHTFLPSAANRSGGADRPSRGLQTAAEYRAMAQQARLTADMPQNKFIRAELIGIVDAYQNLAITVEMVEQASSLIERSSNHTAGAAHRDAFHKECIARWRATLSGSRNAEITVDTSGRSEEAVLSNRRENQLEMARRHVGEGEARVTRQRKIVAKLPAIGELSNIARRLLVEFDRSLRDHKAQLAQRETTS
jgi:hypothetical protein